jgi:YbbR domain-containing protein
MLNWLLRNIRTFFLAFALALAVWVSAVTAADPDEIRTYPRSISLEIIGQNPGMVILGNVPRQVTVTLRAPRSVWDRLTTVDENIQAIADLSGLSTGEHTVNVQIQIQERPVRIITVSPASIDLTLEPLSSRTLPVGLALVGEPAVGYQVGQKTINPQQVVVSGPESLVAKVARAEVVLNINGARENFDSLLEIKTFDEDGNAINGLNLAPKTVKIALPVTQQGGYRDLAVKVAVRGQVADGYRLTNVSVFPPIVTVFSSDPNLVNTLPGYVDTEPFNLDSTSQNVEIALGLILPEGISLVGEQTVRVQVSVAAIQGSLSLSNMPVEITGIDDPKLASISPENVDIILSGPLPLLDKLTANDVKILVDLTGLAPGTHQVTPTAQILINDIQVESVNPAAIEVTISTSTPSAP